MTIGLETRTQTPVPWINVSAMLRHDILQRARSGRVRPEHQTACINGWRVRGSRQLRENVLEQAGKKRGEE